MGATSVSLGWVVFCVLILGAAALDTLLISKPDDRLTSRWARLLVSAPVYVRQIVFWVLAAVLFNLYVLGSLGDHAAWAWLYGYVLEYVLSIDNLFVFQAVFRSYSTPPEQVERALFWGVSAAIVLRLVFFGVGTEILQLGFLARCLFGLALVYSGVKTLRSSDDEDDEDPTKNPLVRCVARLLPVHDQYAQEPLFFLRVAPETPDAEPRPAVLGSSSPVGTVDISDPKQTTRLESGSGGGPAAAGSRWKVTPLFLVVVTLGIIDVIFAVDSVTAKISSVADLEEGLSFFLNLSSSAFAMFVLRSLYTVVSILSSTFRFLGYGVGIVLILIGVKLMLAGWIEVGMRASFLAILTILTASMLASVVIPKKEREDEAGAAQTTQGQGGIEMAPSPGQALAEAGPEPLPLGSAKP